MAVYDKRDMARVVMSSGFLSQPTQHQHPHPLIVFNHGWSAFFPIAYKAWIEHLVKRGNIIVYPRYQLGFIIGVRYATSNAIQAVKKAITILQNGDHVQP